MPRRLLAGVGALTLALLATLNVDLPARLSDREKELFEELKKLKDIVNREVITSYDHRFLNYEVPPFDRVVPTPENIAIDIWKSCEESRIRRRSTRSATSPTATDTTSRNSSSRSW